MKTTTYPLITSETNEEKLLIEKMDISKEEFEKIISHYGVSPATIVELMQLRKYNFVKKDTLPSRTESRKNSFK